MVRLAGILYQQAFLTSRNVSNIVEPLFKGDQHDTRVGGETLGFFARVADVAAIRRSDNHGTAGCSNEWRMAPHRWRRRQHEVLAAGSNQRPERQEPQGCVDMEG
jgi:hypothetical protein